MSTAISTSAWPLRLKYDLEYYSRYSRMGAISLLYGYRLMKAKHSPSRQTVICRTNILSFFSLHHALHCKSCNYDFL